MKKMEKLGSLSLVAIYDILVRCCGASEEDRGNFVRYVENWAPHHTLEWRFQGSLGFGGKVWLYNSEVPYVNFYPEDSNPSRDLAVLKANDELAALFSHGRIK